MSAFFPLPVPTVWLVPSTLNELSVNSSVCGLTGAEDGVGTDGATHTLVVALGFGARARFEGVLFPTFVAAGREVGVAGEVGTRRVGACVVATAVGSGAVPTKDACPGWARTASPKPPATRTAAPQPVINR